MSITHNFNTVYKDRELQSKKKNYVLKLVSLIIVKTYRGSHHPREDDNTTIFSKCNHWTAGYVPVISVTRKAETGGSQI